MKDCVSLEVAQKLQKVGYKREADYELVKTSLGGWKIWPRIDRLNFNDLSGTVLERMPAPTATQLAEELPFNMKGDVGETCYLTIEKSKNVWHIGYENIKGERFKWSGSVAETLPDALGLMMLYLLENGLLTK